MKSIEDLAKKIEKEDQASYHNLQGDPTHLKQFLSKFTFLLSTLPPILIVIVVYLLQWKLLYAFLIILAYHIAFYWCLETKFAYIIQFSQRAKQFLLPYFQKLHKTP